MREDIKKILEYGVMAPSSHNSQPWQFDVSDESIKILPNLARRLKDSDENDRQLFISLGCATENILEASSALGFSPQIDISLKGEIIVKLGKKDRIKVDENTLKTIQDRVTNRNDYVSGKFILEAEKYIKDLETDDTHIFICKDELKERLADVAINAGVKAMESFGFRKELSHYLKNNKTRSKIGMPGYGMGIPTPISFIAPTMINFLNMNKLSRKKDLDLLKNHTPRVVVITTKEDEKSSWIQAGILYQKIALEAERKGLSTAMWAAPIQIGEYFKEFQDILGTDFRPQAFFRLGKADKKTKHSPRLSANETTK